jgi:hypothetical protein
MAISPDFKFRLRTIAQVRDQSINIWRPAPFNEVMSLIFPEKDRPIFLPELDVQQFLLPDLGLYRTTDVYANGIMRGFRLVGGRYEARVDDDTEFVLYGGRAKEDIVRDGIKIPRDSRFALLQTFFDQPEYEKLKNQYDLRNKKDKAASVKAIRLADKEIGS